MAGIEPAYWLLQKALPPYIGNFTLWHDFVFVFGVIDTFCLFTDNNTFSYEFCQNFALTRMTIRARRSCLSGIECLLSSKQYMVGNVEWASKFPTDLLAVFVALDWSQLACLIPM